MRFKCIENHFEEKESFESNDTTLDTKPDRSNSAKSKMDLLLELDQKMEKLKKPPSQRNFAHFMRIGLSGTSINPHRLKAGKDIT